MLETLTALEKVLELLGRQSPDVAGALRLVKELLVKEPCAAELRDVRVAAAGAIERLVKPVFDRDHEKQAEVERLIRHLQESEPFDAEAIAAELPQIAAWMPAVEKPVAGGGGSSGREAPPPEDFRDRLLTVLRLLGDAEPWLIEAVDRLAGSGAPPWPELHTLLGSVVNHGDVARSVWRQEREEIKGSLLEMAEGFGRSLQGMGRVDGEIDQLVGRLRGSDQLSDLIKIQKILVHEAEAIQTHARSLTEQVDQSRKLLIRSRERIKEMDDALQAARDEQLTDPITGLPNRFSFSAHLTRNRERAAHLGEPFALLLCRLEGLPQLLEQMDEKEGRRMVAALAKRFRPQLNKEDYLARLNADVFAIILRPGRREPLLEAASRIEKMLDGIRFRLGAKSLAVRAVFGGAVFEPAMSERNLLAEADRALTRAAAQEGEGVRIQVADGVGAREASPSEA